MNSPKEKGNVPGGKVRPLILLLLLTVAVTVVLANRNIIDISSVKRSITGFFSLSDKAEEFYFDANDTNAFAAVDGGLAVLSAGGLEYYDSAGDMVIKESFAMNAPVIVSDGSRGLVYDVGGSVLRVFDSGGYIFELESGESIISASLNENGWMALVTRSSGYKGAVTVYRLRGRSMDEVYTWYSGADYVLDAGVSPDNGHMAALSISESGSRVVLFSLKSVQEQGSYMIPDRLIIDIEYLSEDSIAAFSEDSVLFLDGGAGFAGEYTFGELKLTDYTAGGFVAVAQNKYRFENVGRIVTLDEKGEIIGVLDTDRQILHIAARGDYIAVLYPEGLTVYTKDLAEYAVFPEAAGAESVVLGADKKAIAAYTYSAKVISY